MGSPVGKTRSAAAYRLGRGDRRRLVFTGKKGGDGVGRCHKSNGTRILLSRGGLTTKVHAAVDRNGRPVQLHLTPGQSGDAPEAPALRLELHPEPVVADAAYASDSIRQQVRQAGAKPCINSPLN